MGWLPYGKYQPGVRVEVPILHLISTGARAEYADLRVWGGMGEYYCAMKLGSKPIRHHGASPDFAGGGVHRWSYYSP